MDRRSHGYVSGRPSVARQHNPRSRTLHCNHMVAGRVDDASNRDLLRLRRAQLRVPINRGVMVTVLHGCRGAPSPVTQAAPRHRDDHCDGEHERSSRPTGPVTRSDSRLTPTPTTSTQVGAAASVHANLATLSSASSDITFGNIRRRSPEGRHHIPAGLADGRERTPGSACCTPPRADRMLCICTTATGWSWTGRQADGRVLCFDRANRRPPRQQPTRPPSRSTVAGDPDCEGSERTVWDGFCGGMPVSRDSCGGQRRS